MSNVCFSAQDAFFMNLCFWLPGLHLGALIITLIIAHITIRKVEKEKKHDPA